MVLEVNLPDTVKIIAENVFMDCQNLRRVIVDKESSELVFIENSAFDGCVALADFDFPRSLKFIGEKAFAQTNLKYIDLEMCELEFIGDAAFVWCKSLMSVTLAYSLKIIGDDCFAYCDNLKLVDLKHVNVVTRGMDDLIVGNGNENFVALAK